MQVKIFTLGLNPRDLKDGEKAMNDFMSTVNVERTSERYVMRQIGTAPIEYQESLYILVFYSEAKVKAEKVQGERESHKVKQFSTVQKDLWNALKIWRKDRAAELEKDELALISNGTLEWIAANHPRNALALSGVSGMNKSLIAAYGDDIIAICNAY